MIGLKACNMLSNDMRLISCTSVPGFNAASFTERQAIFVEVTPSLKGRCESVGNLP